MRVCLIICSAPFLIDQRVFPPLGLMAVASALRARGHSVRITDSPDDSSHFGLGPTTPEYANALAILHQIKLRDSKACVVIGGPHATANAEDCLIDGFDVVAVGDGENITAETFDASGLVDLGHGSLDDYPIADRSLVDIRAYHYEIAGREATTLMTSRGCPYHCAFCAKPGNRVRYYSLGRIEEEITYLRNCFDYNALMIFDDTFILDGKRARGICSALKRQNMAWRCFVRGDLVIHHGQGLIDLMAKSGCVEVAMGIESGSDRILQTIRKGENVGTMRKAVEMLRQAGIRVKGLFIIGLPGEDHASLAATRRFITEVPLDDADFTIYQPYRGSPIWDNRQDYDILWNDLPPGDRFYKGRCGEYNCAVYTSALTQNNIIEARDELEGLFRPCHAQI